jgi:hypothetical protein
MSRNEIALAVSGIGIGWLVGLSASPVTATVIAALMALVATSVGLIAGLRPTEESPLFLPGGAKFVREASAVPVAIVIMSIAAAAPVGIAARAYHWFGPNEPMASASVPQPASDTEGKPKVPGPLPDFPGLFAEVSGPECKTLRSLNKEDLEREMASSKSQLIRKLAEDYHGQPDRLQNFVECLICPEPKE